MNLVLDDAFEIPCGKNNSKKEIKKLGRILLKGDNITLIQLKQQQQASSSSTSTN